MPMNLTTVISRISHVPNQTNAALLLELSDYMQRSGASDSHIKNEIYANLLFATHLRGQSFFDVSKQSDITSFLDTKRKPKDKDPDEKWKTTYNDYLDAIKFFYRWLYNQRGREDAADQDGWETPAFAQIRRQKTTRKSPYADAEKWDKSEIMAIIPYATNARNRAAFALFWDLDARNHEVTSLRIKNLRLNEKYGEGEIPFQTKTGGGPILLTLSFPYVRDWLNVHPFRDNPEARVICSLKNGAPVKPTAMWEMMMSLRKRIARLLRNGEITDPTERELLAHLLMGNNLKMQILAREGIDVDRFAKQPITAQICPKCNRINAPDVKYCTNGICSYPLRPEAYDEIKKKEAETLQDLKEVKEFVAMVRSSKIMDLLRKKD